MTVTEVAGRLELAARTRGEVGDEIVKIMSLSGSSDVITLSGGFPDPLTFPGGVLSEIFARVATEPIALQYAPTAGLPSFRQWLATRLDRLEGRRPAESELIVTSGGIEGLELVAKSVLDPGDTVLVEAPTYLGAIMAFRSYQAEIVTVPMDDGGLDVSALDELIRRTRPKLLYTVSDFQNPTGVSLDSDRRRALVEIARRHGLLVLEDVAYRELHFDDERLPSLWAMAPDVVAQLGTFSKTFTPGFRMGWVAGPEWLVGQLVVAKQNSDQCTGALGQRLLEEYDAAGHLAGQVRRARELYRGRCQTLLTALEEHMPPGVRWTRPRGGFFSWVTAPDGVDFVALYDQAVAAGVAYVPGSPFYPDGRGRSAMRLSFSRVDDERIVEGVRRLAGLVTGALSGAVRQ